MGGFFDLLAWFGWKSSGPYNLTDLQKRLSAEPVVVLTVGSTDLSAFVWGYRYEEKSEDPGGLTIWLENRDDEFDDLSNDYPDLARGAEVMLARGTRLVPGAAGVVVEKMPRMWVEGFRYTYVEGTALLQIECIDWREKLAKFRYAAETTWSATEAATIVASILSEVGLSLASGTFGFTTDFTASPRRAGDQVVLDLMRRVDEFLYSGLDGEVLFKVLDPNEASGYTYDWSDGFGSNHPCMEGTHVAEIAPRFNKIVVIGGDNRQYSGEAEDTTESALMGTRLKTVRDTGLSNNAQCTERAEAELSFWQAQQITGVVVARPNFTLRMHDVLTIEAPPWGGPEVVGRVRRILEEYGRGRALWHQTIEVGGLAGRTVAASDLADGIITADKVVEGEIEADHISVSSLSAITADMGTLTAGTIKMGTGTKDVDLDGFQIDADELVGQEGGVDQVVLSSSDGKITAGAGALILDQDGIQANSGNQDVNKLKIRDGADTVLAMYGEVSDGTGTSGTVECAGKQAADPEGLLELIAKTYDGSPASGVASVTMTFDTENGKIDVGGALRMVMGTCYFEMTEQASAPAAPGANRGRLYLIDNGGGKTQLCIRFSTGAVQVIATEP